jgi:hypothetical protein
MKYLSTISLGLAVAASFFWMNYRSGELLKVNGILALVPLALPVLIASLPVIFPKRVMRGIAAFLLFVFAFIGGMSIGMGYVPAAVVMLIAACVPADYRRPMGN